LRTNMYRPGCSTVAVQSLEQTRVADLLIPSDKSGVAEVCISPISKPLSLLRCDPCCTVLRSRWCQSGVNRYQEFGRWRSHVFLRSLQFPATLRRRSIPPFDRFELRFGSTSLTSVLMLKAAKRYASMTMYSSPEVSESRQFSSSWFATTITGSANCFLLPLHVAQKLPSRLRKWISTLQRWSIHADHKVQGSTPIPPPLA
jgi:hypothetical protein